MSDFDINNLFGVKGMVVVITGGGSGIGLNVAKALDANGAKAVYIIGRRQEALNKAAKEAKSGTIIPIQGDVTSKDSLSAIAEQIRKEQGFINVLFANSGVVGVSAQEGLPKDRKPTIKEFKDAMWKHPIEDFDAAYHVNVTGVFYTCLAFLELLDAGNQRGNVFQKSNIIVTSSLAGFSRQVGVGIAYSTSKAGTTHLVKMLSTYFADYKIRVNALAPGVFPSEMSNASTFFQAGKDPTVEGGMPKSVVPMERAGTEEEIAGTALYLMGRGGVYANGNVLVPDGGRLGQLPSVY